MDSVFTGANFLSQVTGNRKFERVTGTQIGGGTMFGLAKLLTGSMSYDEFLKLSQKEDLAAALLSAFAYNIAQGHVFPLCSSSRRDMSLRNAGVVPRRG